MYEQLKQALIKKAEGVGKEMCSEYLEARKGKVPVTPPTSPGKEGSSSYPSKGLKESSSKGCSKCGKSKCKCESGMDKESAVRRTALNLLKYAAPMPPGAPGAPPPMPPQAPPGPEAGGMPPPPPPGPEAGGMPPGPEGMPPEAGGMPPGGPEAQAPVPPEVMQRLQQHLMEHQMMEQAGMEMPSAAEEEMAPPPPPEAEAPPPPMPEEEQSAPMPEEEATMPEKEAALRILKDMIYGR